MDFRILGPIEVDDDGRSVALSGARQRALLAILLLQRGQVVSSDRLIEDLYRGAPPATAGKSLHAHVSRLRRALAPAQRLHTRTGGYMLEVAPDELDADRMAQLLDDGRRRIAAADADAASTSLEQALRLWRGPPLADVAYESFAQDEIARLGELRLECLEERVEADLALGRHANVVGELERLVADHPLRERVRGQLMLALYRCGRQAEALATYQNGRRALVDELGIDPGRALQELERSMLNQDPRLEPKVQAERPSQALAVVRPAPGIFVGRERELALLEEALGDARSGRGRLVLLSGEAGIGKSRLADKLAGRADEVGAHVLWGRCWEAGGAPAFWPWVQALRTWVREREPGELRDQLGAGAADVAHLVPELRELFPDLPEPAALDSDGARFRLFDSTSAFLRRAATTEPLVIVLDDLHAADASSLLLLEFVGAELSDTRLLILAAYRDPELETGDPIATALADIARRADVRISLRGLAEPDVAAYIEHSAESEPSARLVATITQETEGNPLFVGEIVRLLAADGRLQEPTDAAWRPAIPETVKGVIGRRLERLSIDCKEILALASVIGREFRLDVLEALAGRGRGDVRALVDLAVAARIVTDVPGSASRMRFTHALVRDTLYETLPQSQRRDLHREAVAVIETLAGVDSSAHLSELAYHCFLALPAVDAGTAIAYARRAGDGAQILLAHEEAARLYEKALQALELVSPPDAALQRTLLLSLGQALARAGDMPRAKDAFLEAATLARSSGDAEDLAAAALGYGGRIVWARGAGDRLVVALLEEALEAIGTDDTTLRVRLLARLAGALRDERDDRHRVEIGGLAVEVARRLGDRATLSYALAGLCGAQHALGDSERRLEVARELGVIARDADDKEGQCEGLTGAVLVHAMLNEFDVVREMTRTLAALSTDLRQPSQRWMSAAFEAMLALHDGRLEEAERLILHALELGRVAQSVESGVAYGVQLSLLRREQGRAADAWEPLERAAIENPARPFLRSALASLAVDLDRLSEARREFEGLASNAFEIIPRDNEWLLTAGFLAETCRALGDAPRAEALYAELLPLADRSTANPPEGTTGALARSLGVLAAMLGRHDTAIVHLRRAIEIDTETGGVPWVAYAQVELAARLAERGEQAEAEVLLDEAGTTAASLGLVRLGTRVEALLI